MVALDEALRIIETLIRRSVAARQPIDHTIIMVGGTALAAHRVRRLSEDIDVFMRTFSIDLVVALEAEERLRHGAGFKLDVTGTENLWGAILVRDIDQDARTLVEAFEIDGERFEIRAISVETLFLLKVAAGRQRDRDDLPLLAAKTSAEALIERFNTLVQWHGDRHALAGFADEVVVQLRSSFGCGVEVIGRLDLPELVRRMLWEVHAPTS
ncbi:MAG: nucleotidyl transferase AbiEii/AbiGii toxin family protein [Candidatus Latescibacterota bacterium]